MHSPGALCSGRVNLRSPGSIATTSTPITTITPPDCSHQSHLFLTRLAFCLFLPIHLQDKEWPCYSPGSPTPLANKAFHNTRERKAKTLHNPLLYFYPVSFYLCALSNTSHNTHINKRAGFLTTTAILRSGFRTIKGFLQTPPDLEYPLIPCIYGGIKSMPDSTLTPIWCCLI